jgi:hypothetical protein
LLSGIAPSGSLAELRMDGASEPMADLGGSALLFAVGRSDG